MKKSYKQLQEELSKILDTFEQSSHDDVDMMLADYEKGMAIIKEIETMLEKAELKLKKIKSQQ